MDKLSVKNGKWLGAYAFILGIGYCAAAIVEAAGKPDIFPGGLLSIGVLLVVSATYLMGVKGLISGRRDGISFLMGGLLVSVAVGGLYLLMAGADWLMYLLGEAEDFALLSEISPAIILLVIALPLVPTMRRLTSKMAW
ncbi:MAG TPA: hypothetical protein PKV83_00450 [Methanothrix sp.]|nr:hypothetical protein [Methanothrix sp.]